MSKREVVVITGASAGVGRATVRGAHGDFDDRAATQSLELWAETHPAWVAAAGLGAVAAIYAAVRNVKETAETDQKRAA